MSSPNDPMEPKSLYSKPVDHPVSPIGTGPDTRPYYVLRLVWDQTKPIPSESEASAENKSNPGLPESSVEQNTDLKEKHETGTPDRD